MENYVPTDSTPFLATDDQEDWATFFDFSSAAQSEFPAYDEGMLGAVADVVEPPDYAGDALDMQAPPNGFENHAPGFLAHEGTQGTQWHPCGEDADTVTQNDCMPPFLLEKATGNGQLEAQIATDQGPSQAVRSARPFSAPMSLCGLHGCQLTFPRNDELERHQRFHAPHHWVVSETPFICECGQKCAKLDTLRRHIQRFQASVLTFPCQEPECTKVFKRKDHLIQHKRHMHKFSDAELHAEFPVHRQIIRYSTPVCPFLSCTDHRGDHFMRQSHEYQEAYKPFAKQSDYTKHMKEVHYWSPYPCTAPYCDKKGKNGYFRRQGLQKHRDEQHPEAEPLIMEQ